MKKNRMPVIVLSAFITGVIVTFIGLMIFHKNYVSKDNSASDADYMGTVVIDGFEIPIPNKNMAFVNDEMSLCYSDKGTFEMGISVVDGNYALTLNEMETMNTDLESWFVLRKPFDEIAVGGNSYIYCVYEDEGENILLAYKEADNDHSFEIMVRLLGINQMRFQSEEELIREYESYILIADTLLDGARPVNAENSPSGTAFVADDMYSDLQVVFPEEFLAEDALYNNEGNKLVSYQVEDNFYMVAQEIRSNYYSMKAYIDAERDITVTIIADDQKRTEDARTLMVNGSAIWTDSEAEIDSIEIDGRTIYYYIYIEEYTAMDKECEEYHFEAAVDLGNGKIFRLSAFSELSPEALDIDTYMKFMMIEEP